MLCFESNAVLKSSVKEQSGAVEACWAHNPEVRGSKPRSAKNSLLTIGFNENAAGNMFNSKTLLGAESVHSFMYKQVVNATEIRRRPTAEDADVLPEESMSQPDLYLIINGIP
ncbi:hypothetical protein ABEB36_000951 [Hypothenemus hampei]|uniref:Uncharacterized protein n=1 Tax=Hypothenemus hampei TaxID=57062 RepID=A0ABD1FD05_HYPHA